MARAKICCGLLLCAVLAIVGAKLTIGKHLRWFEIVDAVCVEVLGKDPQFRLR
jgi:hypothetical protein